MDTPTEYNPKAIGFLDTDISWDLFKTNQNVQKVIEPFGYDDLMNFRQTRHVRGEFKVVLTNGIRFGAVCVGFGGWMDFGIFAIFD